MTLGIDVQGLTVRFGDVTAVDDLSVRLAGGKIYGLLGRNGSGKTTLMSAIAAFLQADRGRVLVDGEQPYENPAVTEQICLVRDSGDLADQDSARAALKRAAKFRPNWDAEFAERLIELFRVPTRRGVARMSRGQRSALGVTVGLASRAPVTMLDESYFGMDAPSRYAFYDVLLEDYIEHPRTIVISTHLIEEVTRLFEEVVIIDQGRLVAHDETEALRMRGAAVTGAVSAVEAFTDGMTVLAERRLGGTKSVTVFGAMGAEQRARASEFDVELEPVALQDLFVHLTKEAPR
ncbi:ABC-2 type transport system ATP-binding protein [Haloactinopolyspora alba]|uniref:ABC-2 type transport system ATP-binding protein n=1 Tax=Haloactinopolyspora alba TaxID=648780 RepID=A0A2P8E268_9ACTN|nr:ABC transporter ATP-binding protein [Haloactinopolyspora alba]PSL03552.1 ABC-2 type transport system ATP-binding protein [Haloactinopolyspora alba]